MILSKAGFYLIQAVASVMAFANTGPYSEEWQYFGGLLVGSLLSGLAGIGMLLMAPESPPRQIMTARIIANTCFGLGLGSLGVWYLSTKSVTIGPMLTVGGSFVLGLMGVWSCKKLAEPKIQKKLDDALDRFIPRGRMGVPAKTETVDLSPPVGPKS